MHTENEILSEIETTKAEYLSKVNTLPLIELSVFTNKIKSLQLELSSLLSSGSKPCAICGNLPHGMIFRTQIVSGVRVNLYEVGCLKCENISSRGASAKEAVEKWNLGEYYVRDSKSNNKTSIGSTTSSS